MSIIEDFTTKDYQFLKNFLYSIKIDSGNFETLMSISKCRGLKEIEIMLMQKMYN